MKRSGTGYRTTGHRLHVHLTDRNRCPADRPTRSSRHGSESGHQRVRPHRAAGVSRHGGPAGRVRVVAINDLSDPKHLAILLKLRLASTAGSTAPSRPAKAPDRQRQDHQGAGRDGARPSCPGKTWAWTWSSNRPASSPSARAAARRAVVRLLRPPQGRRQEGHHLCPCQGPGP